MHGLWRYWRLQRKWPEACEAGGILTRIEGKSLDMRRVRVNPSGLTFQVRNGRGGRTVEEVRKGSDGIAAVLATDSVSIRAEGAALCTVSLAWGDPTTKELVLADLPGSPYRYAAFGVARDGQAASLATYLSVLICGLPGSGKSNLIWAYLGGLIRDKIPFAITVIDPAGGVEMQYLKDAPFTKKYVDKVKDADKVISGLRDAMYTRLHFMQGRVRFHTPTEAEPLRLLIIDELLLLGDILQKGANSHFGEILTIGRKAGYIVVGLSQLSQVDALGRIRDLFPQRVCMATKSREMTEAVLGPGAESEGAKCSKITEQQAGVGYLMSGEKREFIRFRAALVTDAEARVLALGALPESFTSTSAPRGVNAAYEVLRKKKTAVYWLFVTTGECIYVGIAVNPNTRIPEHKNDWWWAQVDQTRTRVTWYKSRDVALKVEKQQIEQLHPDGNDVHNRGDDGVTILEGSLVVPPQRNAALDETQIIVPEGEQ